MGCRWKGTSPKWAGHHPLGPMRLGLGGTLKGAPPWLGGQVPSPWPPPPSRSHLEGPAVGVKTGGSRVGGPELCV